MRQDDEKKGQNMVLKVPTRVEWDNENDCVDVLIEDDEEALLLTAQEGVSDRASCISDTFIRDRSA